MSVELFLSTCQHPAAVRRERSLCGALQSFHGMIINTVVPLRPVVCFILWLFCEGLHLLHNEGKWKDISEALHRTVFLDIERSCCFERVVGRKVANGRARESSEAHFARVDGPTFDRLQEDKGNATLILTMRPTMARPLHIFKVDVPSV